MTLLLISAWQQSKRSVSLLPPRLGMATLFTSQISLLVPAEFYKLR